MLVGQTGSGKSVCWKILQAAMTRLKRDGDSNFNIVRVSQPYLWLCTVKSRHIKCIKWPRVDIFECGWYVSLLFTKTVHRKVILYGRMPFNSYLFFSFSLKLTYFLILQEFPINPKALSLGELYGEFDLNTNEWTDGVLSSVMRLTCSGKYWLSPPNCFTWTTKLSFL